MKEEYLNYLVNLIYVNIEHKIKEVIYIFECIVIITESIIFAILFPFISIARKKSFIKKQNLNSI